MLTTSGNKLRAALLCLFLGPLSVVLSFHGTVVTSIFLADITLRGSLFVGGRQPPALFRKPASNFLK